MECRKITLLIILINTICFGQEICNNAIDDDGNGLIDINDPNCVCNTNSNNNSLPSLIPNASFEDFSQCPYEPSQLAFASGWTQCTTATADYMNTCGYIFEAVTTAGLDQFPDGNGVAGAIISNDFREYIGTNLTSTLNAGKTYSLTFNIASLPVNGDGDTCNGGNIDYGSLNITLYGSAAAGNFPVQTTTTLPGAWVAIGSAVYQPSASWGTLTMTFTPSANINSIIIGAPQVLPPSYDNTSCYPYFLFDNLAMSEASAATASVTPTGAFCSGDLVLHANTTINADAHSYQWYKEGISIAGATGETLSIASDISELGNYKVMIVSDNSCVISSNYSVIQSVSEPVATVQPDCSTGMGTISITSAAAQYSFDNGVTWTGSNTSQPLREGIYSVKTKSAAGCESEAVPVIVNPVILPAPAAEEMIYLCQYSEPVILTASGENLLWYSSPSGGIGMATAPKPRTDFAGTQVYYVSQSLNGCESQRTAITVIVNPAPAEPQVNDVVYYLDDNAQPLYATGENITWFDTDGNVLYTAPIPETSRTGIVRYYASQSVNGCESEKAEIIVQVITKDIVINYPKFFTPNGDGVHEQWNITPLADDAKAQVYIYDRNGQFIKQVASTDNGWDGTLNGQNLPSSDYWFRVVYAENGTQKEYMSHFSLVR